MSRSFVCCLLALLFVTCAWGGQNKYMYSGKTFDSPDAACSYARGLKLRKMVERNGSIMECAGVAMHFHVWVRLIQKASQSFQQNNPMPIWQKCVKTVHTHLTGFALKYVPMVQSSNRERNALKNVQTFFGQDLKQAS